MVTSKSLSAYRNRLKRNGMVRLEVTVRKQDVSLVRRVVDALADPAHETDMRALLNERFSRESAVGLKALLAAAPLDRIDLERVRDRGRRVDL
jgi:hypothetical protein